MRASRLDKIGWLDERKLMAETASRWYGDGIGTPVGGGGIYGLQASWRGTNWAALGTSLKLGAWIKRGEKLLWGFVEYEFFY